jgi:hypothetical protein
MSSNRVSLDTPARDVAGVPVRTDPHNPMCCPEQGEGGVGFGWSAVSISGRFTRAISKIDNSSVRRDR